MKHNQIRKKLNADNSKILLNRLRMMTTFLVIIMLSLITDVYAQRKSLSIKLVNTAIKDVFAEIERKTDYIFLFSGDLGDEINRKIDVNIESKSVEEVLKTVNHDTGLKYKILDKQVIIYKSQVITPKHTHLSSKSLAIDKKWIRGVITDQNGEPVVGASVFVPNTSIGTTTDREGKYVLKVPLKGRVRFSCVGYMNQEVEIGNNEMFDIQLKEDTKALGEVVITGYANIRKESFTGTATQINKKELLQVSPGNLIETIQTFDPSFRIMDNIEVGSNPNALPEFYIRGQSGIPNVKELDILESSDVSQFSLRTNPNTPIFILDGFEVSLEKIYDLDMTRIESITLLKDASSTAIYGSRAANGVVVIETVVPKSGKIRVFYSGSYAMTEPDLSSYNLMNTAQKLQVEKDANFFGNPEPWEYKYGSYEKAKHSKMMNWVNKHNQELRGVDTYWLSQPLNTAFNHKHNLFLEGGIEAFRYGINLRYDNSNGVMKKSHRQRKEVGLVLEYINEKLQIRNQVSFGIMANQNSPYGQFSSYVRLQPYYEPMNPKTGEFVKDYSNLWGTSRTLQNPLYEASLGNFSKGGYKEWVNNLSVNWRITQHLLLKGQYAISYNDSDSKVFIDPESTTYSRSDDILKRGELTISNTESLRHNVNLFGAYSQAIKSHYINLSLGLNVVANDFNYANFRYRGFPNKKFNSPAYAHKIEDKPSFSDNKTRLFGSFFTLNYSYNDIYLLDASIRVDGSSEFGSNRKWAPFWSLGTGINLHNYSFLKGNEVLTLLRFTGNIGQIGKSNFAPYMASNMFKIMNDDWYPTGIGAGLIYLGNENLTWEKTLSSNIAAEIALVNRYFFRLDLYNRTTENLISDISLPSSSGFNVYKDNFGEISNKGFEVKVNLGVLKSKDLNLNLYGNLAHNINKINKLSESLKRYNERVDKYFDKYIKSSDNFNPIITRRNKKFAKPIRKFEEGNSLTSIYGMKSLGINPANGKEVYLKKDGSITYDWISSEQQVIGNTEPWGQGSFGLNAQYKAWSLYTTFLYAFGGDSYNQTLVNEVENVDLMHSNADKRVGTQRWVKPGDISPLKNIKEGMLVTRATSRFVQKNNYVKFNSISLGYNFNPHFLKKYGLSMLRLQCNMNDIAVFSTIRREMGTSYPYARTFTFTLNTAF